MNLHIELRSIGTVTPSPFTPFHRPGQLISWILVMLRAKGWACKARPPDLFFIGPAHPKPDPKSPEARAFHENSNLQQTL